MNTPLVAVEVTFLSVKDGGRGTLPKFDSKPWYRPHIVIQDPTIRSPIVDARGMSTEDYLGVQFIDGPKKLGFDHSNRYTLRLMHHPNVDYSGVIGGATFTVREGGRIVGFGAVILRQEATRESEAVDQMDEPKGEPPQF